LEAFPTKIQTIAEGVGPAYHRVYRIKLAVGLKEALVAMDRLKSDINSFSPQWMATFEKKIGEGAPLKKGHGFQIHISGPWNGPVLVSQESEEGFGLSTLSGHLEAGNIFFWVEKEADGVYFVIESIARSKDQLVNLLYDKVPIVKLAQKNMWESFCATFAKEAGKLRDEDCPEVTVKTERLNEETGQWEST
jgi:hypothetical protein